jgi:uncharacterized repeat protein (TIGR03803 family)
MLRFLNIGRRCLRASGLTIALLAPLAGAQAHVSVLYAFKGGADGLSPSSSVVVDKQGNLYGTTAGGGGLGCGGGGCGTIYKITPYGAETLLYSFKGGEDDGANPTSLIRDDEGNFYGTTYNGGLQTCYADCGTVFKLAADGTETILHFFAGGNDGQQPIAGLLRDKAGNLYGTTEWGGAGLSVGTAFRIAPDGTETVLYTFCSLPKCADGESPISALIMDRGGNLYGTTSWGGTGIGGNVFELKKSGTLKVLYNFCESCQTGGVPQAGVIMDRSGNFFGTAAWGGAGCAPYGCGAVFELQPDGTETALHAFSPSVDGQSPAAGVIMDSAGNLYGTVGQSKAPACKGKPGVVFSLAPGGAESIDCISSPLVGGVVERNGMLYGAATGEGNFKYPAGFIFAVRK